MESSAGTHGSSIAARVADRFEILSESSRRFAAIIDLHELVEVVARSLADNVGEGCALRLVAPSGDAFDESVTTTFHPDPELQLAARQLAASQPLQLGEGITGRVVATGTSCLVPVISTSELLAQTPPEYHALMIKLAISSLLVVPLKARGRVLGVIALSRSDPGSPYSVEDQRLAEDLAARAALAVDNALLVAALRKSESRFRRLVESGIVGIVRSDTAGLVHEANDAFLAMVGYTSDDLAAGRIDRRALSAPESESTNVRFRKTLYAEGRVRPQEREMVRKDGSRMTLLMGTAGLDGEDGYLSVAIDLTEQKRAEAATHASEARKTAVMEAALDAVVVMDHEGRIVDFNAAAERCFGHSRADVIGELLGDVIVPPSLREAHARGLARYLATGDPHVLGRRLEMTAIRKGGEEFPAEVAVVRIRSTGSPLFTGYIRDITERRRAAENDLLRRGKEAAEAANGELEAFSYSVAHDLRAPLRGISGFTSAFLEDHGQGLDADAKAPLLRVLASAERMGEIIDALLSLARLTRTALRPQSVDLTAMAKSVAEQLRAAEPHRNAVVTIEDGLTARGDPRLLLAMLENLLGNAWKFTRKQAAARIDLGRTPAPHADSYFVRDNGAGFDVAYVDKLFQPFQRLHSREEFEGTGIGLATVARIVRRHGGRVWAESTPGGGACFHFTLSAGGGSERGDS